MSRYCITNGRRLAHFRKEVFHLPDFIKRREVSAMPITITFHICGITVSIKLYMSKSEHGKKQNRHSAK